MCILVLNGKAQRIVPATDSFSVTGQLKTEKAYTINQLDTLPDEKIKDQIIFNQNGEPKDTLRNLRGIRLIQLLSTI